MEKKISDSQKDQNNEEIENIDNLFEAESEQGYYFLSSDLVNDINKDDQKGKEEPINSLNFNIPQEEGEVTEEQNINFMSSDIPQNAPEMVSENEEKISLRKRRYLSCR